MGTGGRGSGGPGEQEWISAAVQVLSGEQKQKLLSAGQQLLLLSEELGRIKEGVTARAATSESGPSSAAGAGGGEGGQQQPAAAAAGATAPSTLLVQKGRGWNKAQVDKAMKTIQGPTIRFSGGKGKHSAFFSAK